MMMRLAFGKHSIKQNFNFIGIQNQNSSRLNSSINSISQNQSNNNQNINSNKSFSTFNSTSSIATQNQKTNQNYFKGSLNSKSKQTIFQTNNNSISNLIIKSTKNPLSSFPNYSQKHYFSTNTNTNTTNTKINPIAQNLIHSLQKRGLIQDFTPSIERMSAGSGIYIGFDPTAG